MDKYKELFELHRSVSVYKPKLQQVEEAILDGRISDAEKLMAEIPDTNKMLEVIFEHLKGKAVYDVLRKIKDGQIRNPYEALKGLSSLLTHIMIECERGNEEFIGLASRVCGMIYEKLLSLGR